MILAHKDCRELTEQQKKKKLKNGRIKHKLN